MSQRFESHLRRKIEESQGELADAIEARDAHKSERLTKHLEALRAKLGEARKKRENGLPYSIEEAEQVVKTHDMDEYHRSLMQFLIDKLSE
jgi:hypothetical protein